MKEAGPITQKRLMEYLKILTELKDQQERVAEARAAATSAAALPAAWVIKSSIHPGGIASHLVSIEQYEMKAVESIIKLYDEKTAIEEAVQRLEKSEQREVIRLRYFDDLEWHDISTRLGSSVSKAFNLHREALESLLRL